MYTYVDIYIPYIHSYIHTYLHTYMHICIRSFSFSPWNLRKWRIGQNRDERSRNIVCVRSWRGSDQSRSHYTSPHPCHKGRANEVLTSNSNPSGTSNLKVSRHSKRPRTADTPSPRPRSHFSNKYIDADTTEELTDVL